MAVERVVDPRVTFAELAAWPDDGRQYELYDGEVIKQIATRPKDLEDIRLLQILRRELP